MVLLSPHALIQAHWHALVGYVEEIRQLLYCTNLDEESWMRFLGTELLFKQRNAHGTKYVNFPSVQNANPDAWVCLHSIALPKTTKLGVF